MTLRLAKPHDIGRILDLLEETHQNSRYAELDIDRACARSLVTQAIQRNFGQHDGGCIVIVEVVDNRVEAFILGTLNRVYLISTALSAKDVFLVASEKASKLAARKLLGGYIEWATRNPKVYEIELSHTDITPTSERIGDVYERMGFEPFGKVYRRANPAFGTKQQEAQAA